MRKINYYVIGTYGTLPNGVFGALFYNVYDAKETRKTRFSKKNRVMRGVYQMLYCELLTLTDNNATYEQYLDIEAVYMKKDSMTKEQASRLWKRRYGVKKSKPRSEELRRIKGVIRDLKNERDWSREMARLINKKYDDLIDERLFDFYGKTLEEIRNEPENSTTTWLAQQTLNHIEKERKKAIYNWYDDVGNDTTIYIIYKDGSTLHVTGTEIAVGDVTPKMQNIAYAHYDDGWETFDTEIGNIDLGLYSKTAEEFNYDVTDEMLEIRDNYERDIEIKFGTEWGLKQKNVA